MKIQASSRQRTRSHLMMWLSTSMPDDMPSTSYLRVKQRRKTHITHIRHILQNTETSGEQIQTLYNNNNIKSNWRNYMTWKQQLDCSYCTTCQYHQGSWTLILTPSRFQTEFWVLNSYLDRQPLMLSWSGLEHLLESPSRFLYTKLLITGKYKEFLSFCNRNFIVEKTSKL